MKSKTDYVQPCLHTMPSDGRMLHRKYASLKKGKRMGMISVVIPTYNCRQYIEKAVKSALLQTIQEELEVIVIDDASTDGTKEAIRQTAAEAAEIPHRSFVYYCSEVNLGVAEARNTGIRMAKGELLAFLDADDWWELDKLEKQVGLLRKTGAQLVYSGRELMQCDGQSLGKVIAVPETTTYRNLLRTNCIPCSSVLMRTAAAREFYMCHDELHEDYILWLRILQKYGQAYGIDEPLLKSRLSAGGKSRNKLKSAKMHYGVYKYMGIGPWKAVWLFLCYAVNGVKKYR